MLLNIKEVYLSQLIQKKTFGGGGQETAVLVTTWRICADVKEPVPREKVLVFTLGL
jgi:hypothetical protein